MEVPENRPRSGLKYQQIEEACRNGDLSKAGALAEEILTENPEDLHAMYLLCRILVDSGKPGIAQPIALHLTNKAPHKAQGWLILGAVEATLQRPEESIAAIKRCLEIEQGWAEPYRCLSSSLVLLNRLDEAKEAALKAMEFEDHHIPRAALAFVEMHKRNWKEGWEHYRHQLGRVKYRDYLDFGIPEWNGENERGSLLIYAEQGLGDQLCYVSAIDQCKQLVCHPKLESLLRRSLPNMEVYGEQFKTPVTFEITSKYQSSMASAMRWQEVKRRGRWLEPHPEKKLQWKALMDSKERFKGAPWVGLGWTGGSIGSSGWKNRNLKVTDLKPILDLPLNFVSLEYRPHTPPPGVHMWPWATQTPDYEDTAALVDNLSSVVCVPTTVYHLAGSLGIPAHVIVHTSPHFHEGVEGDSPWWSSVSFYRRTEMSTEECVLKIADKLKELL
ncbi:MAG: hypothetical protein E6Q97_27395 [Desulfurellales bacterium]|nr:MAG: hypothetical protein E6Q97_27395 [Desulfurellales bacterium]